MAVLQFTCVHCDKQVERTYRGSGVKPTICGNACKIRAFRTRNPHSRDKERKHSKCRECGAGLSHGRKICSFCSEAGRKVRTCILCGISSIMVRKFCRQCSPSVARRLSARTCKRCGIGLSKKWITLCADCKRSQKRDEGKSWRKRCRALGLPYEPIVRTIVFERDGWRCQICGRSTPKRLKGTSHKRSPTLDHRIPLSRGGPHQYENVQCACRECNTTKGNRSNIGQMHLFPNPNIFQCVGGGR